eukprot:Polyplicarium_translucidae@DN5273_c0_g1_i1.p1
MQVFCRGSSTTGSGAGIGITITTATNLISFVIGSCTPYLAVRNFCVVAAAGLLGVRPALARMRGVSGIHHGVDVFFPGALPRGDAGGQEENLLLFHKPKARVRCHRCSVECPPVSTFELVALQVAEL